MHVLRILEKKNHCLTKANLCIQEMLPSLWNCTIYLVFENKNTRNVPVALKAILLLKEEIPVLWVTVIARKSECVCL